MTIPSLLKLQPPYWFWITDNPLISEFAVNSQWPRTDLDRLSMSGLKKLVLYWLHALYCLQVTFLHWRIYWKRKIPVGTWFIHLTQPPINTKWWSSKTKALGKYLAQNHVTWSLYEPHVQSMERNVRHQQKPWCHKYSVLSAIRVRLGFREFL